MWYNIIRVGLADASNKQKGKQKNNSMVIVVFQWLLVSKIETKGNEKRKCRFVDCFEKIRVESWYKVKNELD